MRNLKRKKLERAGWKVGTVREFLGLTQEENVLIEMRLALAQNSKKRRAECAP